MNQKISLSILSLLTLIVFSGAVSAGALTINEANYPNTAIHNSDIIITFNVTYSGSLSPVQLRFNESTTNIGSWKTLPAITTILNNSVPVSFSAVLTIPQFASGMVNAQLKADTSSASVSQPITITINQTPSFIITPSSQKISKSNNGTYIVTNTGNTALNLLINSTGNLPITLSSQSIAGLAPSSSVSFIAYLSNLNEAQTFLAKTSTISVYDNSASAIKAQSQSATASLPGSFCKYGLVGGNLTIKEIADKSSMSNEWEWKPLDLVKIRVKVENADKDLGGGKDRDITIKLGLFKTSSSSEVDLESDNEIEKDVSINEGQTKTIDFEFQVPADVDEGSYSLYVKAYDGESTQCTSAIAEIDSDGIQITRDIDISKDNYDVIVDGVDSLSDTFPCDSDVDLTARVYNIGNNDEDKVRVTLYNKELNLKLTKEIIDLAEGDSTEVNFNFVVPKTAQERSYKTILSTEFKYDSDTEVYKKESKTEDDFEYTLKVLGNCQAVNNAINIASINANLKSVAKVGTQLSIQVDVRNLGNSTADFIISTANYDSWAKFISIEPQSLNIEAGQTKSLLVKLNPTKSGDQTFNIRALSGGKFSTQSVQVTIAEKSGSIFGSNSTLMYVIIAVAIILIILIILIIVKVASSGSKRKTTEF